MKNDYALAGIAALVLAILFPSLMVYELINYDAQSWKDMLVDTREWGLSHYLFIMAGMLAIFVLYNFKKILNEQQNFKSLDVLLWILMILSAVFHIVLVIAEAYVGASQITADQSMNVGIGLAGMSISVLIAFGIVDIVVGVVLIINRSKLPNILTALGIVSIIQGVFEISIILMGLAIVSFPIYMIILAIYLLSKPETIEVV